MEDKFILGGKEFQSRFILGSGKYNLNLIKAAVEQGGAEIITLALRRANTKESENILDFIPEGVTLLPNTSGARNAEEAVRIARLSRAMGCGNFVKVEIMRDAKYLFPDNYETIRATEILAKEGFVVLPYMNPDLNVAEIAGLLQARCEKLTDIPEKVDFFDALPEYPVDYYTNKKSKTNPDVSRAMLEAVIPVLEGLTEWTDEAIHDALVDLAQRLEVKNATLMWPVRIAAAGKLVTPGGAVEICRILGKDETLRRLNAGLAMLGA